MALASTDPLPVSEESHVPETSIITDDSNNIDSSLALLTIVDSTTDADSNALSTTSPTSTGHGTQDVTTQADIEAETEIIQQLESQLAQANKRVKALEELNYHLRADRAKYMRFGIFQHDKNGKMRKKVRVTKNRLRAANSRRESLAADLKVIEGNFACNERDRENKIFELKEENLRLELDNMTIGAKLNLQCRRRQGLEREFTILEKERDELRNALGKRGAIMTEVETTYEEIWT